MNVRVIDLVPGDEIKNGTMRAIFLVQSPHPLYTGLQLVVWWLPSSNQWSFDALSPIQVVGDRVELVRLIGKGSVNVLDDFRRNNLKLALQPGG